MDTSLTVKVITPDNKTVEFSDDFTKRRILAVLASSPLSESLQKSNPSGVLAMFAGKNSANQIVVVDDNEESTDEYKCTMGELVSKLEYHIGGYQTHVEMGELVKVVKTSKLEKTVSTGGRGRKAQSLEIPDF